MADLARKIELPLEMDYMAISSYGNGAKSSGVVRILKDSRLKSKGVTSSWPRTSSTPVLP